MSTKRSASLGAALLLGGVFAACVVAEPPSDLPRLPERRPTILRGELVPSASAVLSSFPAKLIVPVELADPRSTFWYSAFVDYNPLTGEGLEGRPTPSEFEPGTGSTKGNVRTLEIPLSAPSRTEENRCHVIEVVVALRLKATTDSKNAHTPDEPGGDSALWFFSPGGDLAGCPVLDAGIVPLVPDAEAEGGPP